MLSSATDMTGDVMNENGQKTNGTCVNSIEFHCSENISSYFHINDTNANCHDSSELDEII